MTQSRLLVLCVVSVALIAYTGLAFVLWSRRGGATWTLLCADAACAWLRTAFWLLLIFERPEMYDDIPNSGWGILVSQTIQSFVMWALAFRVLKPNHGGAQ